MNMLIEIYNLEIGKEYVFRWKDYTSPGSISAKTITETVRPDGVLRVVAPRTATKFELYINETTCTELGDKF
jgi:hypothetical protein